MKIKKISLLVSGLLILLGVCGFTGCKTQIEVYPSESKHMVLTNTNKGVEITVTGLDATEIKALEPQTYELRVYQDKTNLFAMFSFEDTVLFPFVENGKTYTFKLQLQYVGFDNKIHYLTEKASIKAKVTEPVKCPVNTKLAKEIKSEISYDSEKGNFNILFKSKLNNFDGIIDDENVSRTGILLNLTNENRLYPLGYGMVDFSEFPLNEVYEFPIYASGDDIKIINGTNTFDWDTNLFFMMASLPDQVYGYEFSRSNGKINPVYEGKGFVGNWKEKTENETFDVVIIDKYGFVTLYEAAAERFSYGIINYKSDSDIKIKLSSDDEISAELSEGSLILKELNKKFEKETGNVQPEMDITYGKEPDVNITYEIIDETLYVDLNNDDYDISDIYLDGLRMDTHYSSSSTKGICDLDGLFIKTGKHTLTVYYRNSNILFSKTLYIEIN
ncbi:MAG: hypothetical protein MJ162_07845 [Treponema sp.]|nr:hypothetical protein [Treponema sp.]